LEIEISDFNAGNTTLKGDYVGKVVEIVIRGVPTIRKIRIMFLFMSLSRILLECSVSTNLFGLMRQQVNLWKVEVGI
jgi:hypothetical protein